jgi:hypothetical protein
MHLHKYTKWEEYRQFVSEHTGSILLVQKRTCTICGKVKLRTQYN